MSKIVGKIKDGIRFGIMEWSLKKVRRQHGWDETINEMKRLHPDLSKQYTEDISITNYYDLKIRNQHCFQVKFSVKAILENFDKNKAELNVVDIGDSAGTHLEYISNIIQGGALVHGTSVNLDENAVNKINSDGGHAVLCRAEEYNPEKGLDFFLSYQMVEHLHNPALFFHRLAKANTATMMIITVPYVKNSRVALRYSLNGGVNDITAEQEHIFELSPNDWKKLLLHSGWQVIDSEIYYQYPRKIPFVSPICSYVWKKNDFEGFLGLVLKRDMAIADRYRDWED